MLLALVLVCYLFVGVIWREILVWNEVTEQDHHGIEGKYYLFMHCFYYERIRPASEASFCQWALRCEDNWHHGRLNPLPQNYQSKRYQLHKHPAHFYPGASHPLPRSNTCSGEKVGQSPNSIQPSPHLFLGLSTREPSIFFLLLTIKIHVP